MILMRTFRHPVESGPIPHLEGGKIDPGNASHRRPDQLT